MSRILTDEEIDCLMVDYEKQPTKAEIECRQSLEKAICACLVYQTSYVDEKFVFSTEPISRKRLNHEFKVNGRTFYIGVLDLTKWDVLRFRVPRHICDVSFNEVVEHHKDQPTSSKLGRWSCEENNMSFNNDHTGFTMHDAEYYNELQTIALIQKEKYYEVIIKFGGL